MAAIKIDWGHVLSLSQVLLLAAVAPAPGHGRGSCKESGLCCTGRDSSCVVQKGTINAIVEDPSEKPCYCDHACMKLSDCCTDFKETCGVTDCEVTEWEDWSPCNVKCGSGTMERRRSVTREPHNGGRHCPPLVQQRGCHGTQCIQDHQRGALRETAMLLPSLYSSIRQLNETHDIRKNLRLRYPKDPAQENSRDYCVEFEVVKASHGCRKEDEFKALREGDSVCVSCEKQAQLPHLQFRCRGDGVYQRPTRFVALSAFHCHGKWARKQTNANDDYNNSNQCSCKDESEFIFV